MNRRSDDHAHQLSSSTVMNLRTGRIAEADGILQALLWLNRTPESFVSGYRSVKAENAKLPEVALNRVLRFDTEKLYVTLNTKRVKKNVYWTQLAEEIGLSESILKHLSKGGRTAFPPVMRILRWLKEPASSFVREAKW